MDLRLRVQTVETAARLSAVLVEVGGEIDMHSAPQLRAALLKSSEAEKGGVSAATPRVLIDLSEVVFIDSTGIGVLVGALKRAREAGGGAHFCGAQTRVRRVFEITGLLGALPLFESRAAALAAWDSAENKSENEGEEPGRAMSDGVTGTVSGAVQANAQANAPAEAKS